MPIYAPDTACDVPLPDKKMCIRDRITPSCPMFLAMTKQLTVVAEPSITRIATVSYTHLDVYKRQVVLCLLRCKNRYWWKYSECIC